MKLLLVRHGQTEGNRKRTFCGGRTDEPVCEAGRQALLERNYPSGYKVFASPMLRCRQTAEYIFGESDPVTIEKLRECDFGRLEGKTHKEMEKDPEYQAFLEAGGSLPYPGGESIEDFGARCIEGIKEVMEESIRRNYEQTACVVHGGVIMAVMHWLVEGSRHYYDWNPGNGEGYLLSIDTGAWKKGDYHGTVIAGITDRIYS